MSQPDFTDIIKDMIETEVQQKPEEDETAHALEELEANLTPEELARMARMDGRDTEIDNDFEPYYDLPSLDYTGEPDTGPDEPEPNPDDPEIDSHSYE